MPTDRRDHGSLPSSRVAAHCPRGLSSGTYVTINPESTTALAEHWKKTMHFHLAVDFDTAHGGYFQQITREGEVLDHVNRNLNNTTRGVYTYALAACVLPERPPQHSARHRPTAQPPRESRLSCHTPFTPPPRISRFFA
jgi:hypothetical protein